MILAAALLAACGGAGPQTTAPAPKVGAEQDRREEAPADLDAAGLRAALNHELQAQTYLTAAAAGAALAGDSPSFDAAVAELKTGSAVDLADLVAGLYGPEVGEQFLGLWNSQIDMVIDYSTGVAAGEQPEADAALERLEVHAQTLADTLEQLTAGGLPVRASQPLILERVSGLKTVIDSQKTAFASQRAEDFATAYAQLRQEMRAMDMIAEPLAAAIAAQRGIPGEATGDAAEVRVDLAALLAEHAFLEGLFTHQVLAGNAPGAQGAKAAVGQNADALSAAFGRVSGPDTAATFARLWGAHIGVFGDYAAGVAAGEAERASRAAQRLTMTTAALADGLEQIATLPADASRPLIAEQVGTLKTVVDAQRAKDFPTAFAALRRAASQTEDLAAPLAAAIAQQRAVNSAAA